jgi:hypothetical protein
LFASSAGFVAGFLLGTVGTVLDIVYPFLSGPSCQTGERIHFIRSPVRLTDVASLLAGR